MGVISDMLAGIPGVKQDWKVDFKEDAKADWKVDWDALPGDAPAVAPVNTVLPMVSGTLKVGQMLSVTTGTWTGNPAPTFTYQWFVDGSPVMGEDSSSYTIQPGDLGLDVSVEVTATNVAGSASEEVSAGFVVQEPNNVVLPLITGTVQVGQTLTVSDGTWTGFPAPTFTYSWLYSPTSPPSASWSHTGVMTSSYLIPPEQAGGYLFVQVYAENSEGTVTAETAFVGPIAP